MSRPNQEVKHVYMLKDNILLKDEQLKRKKTDNENDCFTLEVAITLCFLCVKLLFLCLHIFFQPIYWNKRISIHGT